MRFIFLGGSMKFLKIALVAMFFVFCFVSCGGEDDEKEESIILDTPCETTLDCPMGYVCDKTISRCSKNDGGSSQSGETADSGDESDSDDSGDSGSGNSPKGSSIDPCTPGTTQYCPYQGNPDALGKGPCKEAVRTCNADGTWGKCIGEVLPVFEIGDELCHNNIDDDCNGVIDDGTDLYGEGTPACTYEEVYYDCDYEVDPSSKDPYDYAKAMGICKTTTEDSDEWGLISAKISAPEGTATPHATSNGLLSALGNVIRPKEGGLMLGLSSGTVSNPAKDGTGGGTNNSGAPADWYKAHGNSFPSAGSCPSSGTSGDVNDAVMLTLKIRTPKAAKSFSFNIYFLTYEYPTYICSIYNDFFIALLDSLHTSPDPALQNPYDKNLAMDAKGNPVGVNLAPGGLFTQCVNVPGKGVTSCVSTEELQGTGFESNGGTGWLTTRGNVKGGEVITLRLAIWDLSDHALDSLILIDNFRWDVAEHKPGTSL